MRKFHTVNLVLFKDEDVGSYGCAHEKTHDNNSINFNAFWDGIGIFHDVFEHWFEKEHKYFQGDYAMNVGGEMAAMGASSYYYHILGVYNRPLGNHDFGDAIRATTFVEVQDAIQDGGYTRFGKQLLSNVPIQSKLDNSELEYQIFQYWQDVKKLTIDERLYEPEDAIEYKKSVTFRKIADLHRYGHRMAERLVPDNNHNRMVLVDFIDYFNDFCKRYNAEDLYAHFSTLEISLYKNSIGEISWKAKLCSRYPEEIKDEKLTVDTMYLEYAY